MKIFRVWLLLPALFLFNAAALLAEQDVVVCSTSFLSVAVKNIVKGYLQVVTLCPGSVCPGHFDLKAGDVVNLSSSALILKHGWENFLDFEAVKNKKVVSLEFYENPMLPEAHIKLVNDAARALVKEYPRQKIMFNKNAKIYIDKVLALERGLGPHKKHFAGINVLCSHKIKSYVSGIGFNVVAAYPDSNDISAGEMADVLKKSGKSSVKLIIQNMQSASKNGAVLAAELGRIKMVVISNFPEDDGEESYLTTFRKNIDILVNILK